jgi:hypothetical protein
MAVPVRVRVVLVSVLTRRCVALFSCSSLFFVRPTLSLTTHLPISASIIQDNLQQFKVLLVGDGGVGAFPTTFSRASRVLSPKIILAFETHRPVYAIPLIMLYFFLQQVRPPSCAATSLVSSSVATSVRLPHVTPHSRQQLAHLPRSHVMQPPLVSRLFLSLGIPPKARSFSICGTLPVRRSSVVRCSMSQYFNLWSFISFLSNCQPAQRALLPAFLTPFVFPSFSSP